MKRLFILSISLLLILGCQQEAVTGHVGQQFLLKADVPEEVGTFDYIWKITDLPESSELSLSDIQFSEDESQAIFIPDVAGHYTLQVTVWNYNDKLGAIAYNYDILEAGTQTQNDTEAWLNESVDGPSEVLEDKAPEATPYHEETEQAVETNETIEQISEAVVEEVVVDPNFTIQISAEPTKEAAQNTVDKFLSTGFDAYIQEVTTASNAKMYRVRVGKFVTRDEADVVANRLETEFGISPWITKYQK